MGQAEEHPKEEEKKKPPPRLDAILPDHIEASPGDMLSEIDHYQKKIENDWEEAKSAYHLKIDRLMEDFLKETMPNIEAKGKPEATESEEQRLESLIRRAERTYGSSPNLPRRSSFSPAPAPHSFTPFRQRLWRPGWIVAALIAAALGVGGYGLGAPYLLGNVTPLPALHTAGAFLYSGQLYVVDWVRKALVIHSVARGLPVKSIESAPNAFLTGLVMTDRNLWTADGFNGKILRHSLSPEHDVVNEYPAPGKKPVGLSLDNGSLWTADAESHVLYRLQGNDPEEVTDQFAIPEGDGDVTALQVKDGRAWILDGKSREVRLYRIQPVLKSLGSLDLDSYIKGARPTGIVVEGKWIDVVTEQPSLFVRIPLRKIVR
jgi:hypothetical protein